MAIIDRKKIDETVKRIQAHLKSVSRTHPDLWKFVDQIRSSKGKTFSWPSWCFMPMGFFADYLMSKISFEDYKKLPVLEKIEFSKELDIISMLAPWRVSQGIYTFHPELLNSLIKTPIGDDIPTQHFYHLPEWAIYIMLENNELIENIKGFFCSLEYDLNNGNEEIRFLLDLGDDFFPMLFPLKARSVQEAIQYMKEVVIKNLKRYNHMDQFHLVEDVFKYSNQTGEIIKTMVSLTLYLCAENADILNQRGESRPSRPKAVKTKKGFRYFPPKSYTLWSVGYRVGYFLEKAMAERDEGTPHGSHRSPRPHIRRAHWHSYWIGPRNDPDRRKLTLKWLPPIPVNIRDTENLDNILPKIININTNKRRV